LLGTSTVASTGGGLPPRRRLHGERRHRRAGWLRNGRGGDGHGRQGLEDHGSIPIERAVQRWKQHLAAKRISPEGLAEYTNSQTIVTHEASAPAA
jgi:hypothetical protein